MIEVAAMAISCSLGNSVDSVLESLQKILTKQSESMQIKCSSDHASSDDSMSANNHDTQDNNDDKSVDWLTWSDEILVGGKSSYFGKIKGSLPQIPDSLKHYKSRNNQVLLQCAMQIETQVRDLIQAHGAHRVGLILGTTTSGLEESDKLFTAKSEGKQYEDFLFSVQEPDNGAQFLSDYFGIKGPAYTISTACSSSARAIISAKRLIECGAIDAAIVGGADTLCRMPVNGFDSLDSLSYQVCRPFAVDRNGINIGEAGALMLLKSASELDTKIGHGTKTSSSYNKLESCQSNHDDLKCISGGSKEKACDSTDSVIVIAGVGESSDSHHISAPHPEGVGAIECMLSALKDAKLEAKDIAYINVHGTATPLNDKVESLAINHVFGQNTPCSSIKYLLGHTLGAAGICEAVICALMLKHDLHIPMQNCTKEELDEANSPCGIVTDKVLSLKTRNIMSNSFAFGGNNVSLIFSERL